MRLRDLTIVLLALALVSAPATADAGTRSGPLPAPVPGRAAPTFNGSVYAIAHRGTTVYVGGEFTTATSAGRTYPRRRLAAYDARTGALLSWAPPADGTVRALISTPDAIYAAGFFHTVAGRRRDAIARLSPDPGRALPPNRSVLPFAHQVDGTPYALAAANGRLYLAGSFTRVDGEPRANLAAFSLATGRLDETWKPATDDRVHALAVSGDRIYLGGGFHTVDDVRGSLRLAVADGRTGVIDPWFQPRPVAEVTAIAVDGAGVYVATGGQGGRAVAYAFDGRMRWQRVFDGDATAITTAAGVTYVGGHFDRACNTPRNGPQGACLDGALPRVKLAAITPDGRLADWNPQANGVIGVRALAAGRNPATLEAGGDFTTIGRRPQARFASFSR
ncbi:hypothetical protein GCM10010168_68560 [Actinoplanes ianthinogenes]|uniref:Uncharacterized protein n=1 Tax=Actinoplanes ianthinogenes TaxID=122358 RepID=A0ABN6CG00_9ACTN|nr:hypothetical protein [Actinoplanes ianthinogenes]BCJ44053.1 hypothetical protein Aiant_47100 [Actinoplanes ianthinogenes]GGR40044.1 hypothetical protein GCM10010168_68560 [Actinoplanes ianthinogenes]